MSTHVSVPSKKPRGLLRVAFRLPVRMYRLHLGWLFGRRLLLLTHQGRTSGRVYFTALEVVHYDKVTHESIVVAGYGSRADWYQNIHAHPALQIHTGLRRYVPRQRFLTPEEGEAVLADYQKQHPFLTRMLLGRMYGFDGSPEARAALAHLLPMVGFRPAATSREIATTSN